MLSVMQTHNFNQMQKQGVKEFQIPPFGHDIIIICIILYIIINIQYTKISFIDTFKIYIHSTYY